MERIDSTAFERVLSVPSEKRHRQCKTLSKYFITYPIKKTLKNIDAEFIFIFGSFARGEFNSKSDVDLMIIGDVKSMEVYKKTREIEKEINREINPIILKIEDLKKQKNSGFIKDIFKKGIIMVKGEKNELQKIVR